MLDFARDKKLWENVRVSDDFSQHRKELLALYEKSFKEAPRPHSASDILENNDNGLWRLQFDQLQSSALLSLIYPDNKEYYNALVDTAWAYLNEYTWAPLGHYTEFYYGRTPKDFDYGLLDIFACSVAFSLAEIKSLFADRFPQLLIDRITYEIRRRTIEPFLNRKFFWETHNNNWTAVCTGAVGSVLIYEAPELYFENQKRLHDAMTHYLDSYKEDGMCVEGVGYWYFGFGFFACFAMLERELTNGSVDYLADPKVKEIAKFLQKTFLQRDILVTFGDCSINQSYFFGIPHMLRTVYGDEIEKLPPDLGLVVEDNTHFAFALRSIIYYSKDNISDSVREGVTYTAKNSCYLFKRTSKYGFGSKGGNNGESHNHIDVGTFIIANKNRQIICDTGAGPYEEGYHTDKRYTFFHPSAKAHNIPTFDGVGEDSIRRDDVVITYDEASSSAKMDIKEAYEGDYVKRAERCFLFEEDKITLCDSFDFTREVQVTEHFVSLIEPKIVDGVVEIDNVVLTTPNECEIKIEEKQVLAHLGNRAHSVYLIDYVLPRGKKEFKIEFDMSK